jgi:hypothetical protein
MVASVRRRILVTAKAYPDIGKKYGEAVCVAGIDRDTNDWIRLYPVAFHDLPLDRKFAKYDTVEADARKSKSDLKGRGPGRGDTYATSWRH